MTKFEKLMLINAHPVKFWLNNAGGLIGIYFLWHHDLIKAILTGGLFIFGGTFLTVKVFSFNADDISKTYLGKLFLLCSSKPGFIIYMLSHILIPISSWFNNVFGMISGLFMFIFGTLIVSLRKT